LFGENTNFTLELGQRTSTALAIYAAGLLSFAWVKVLVTGFYAMKDTKTPVLVASASMLLNIVLNILLVRPLGYRGLALATTVSFTANAAALYFLLSKRIGPLWNASFITALVRMATASVMMVAVLHVTYLWSLSQFDGDGLPALLIQTLLPIGLAGSAYLGFCKLFGVEELSHFTSMIRRR
jgi:putative peptidoglycan lipid II flippase